MRKLVLGLAAAGLTATLSMPLRADDETKPMATADYPWCSATVKDHCTNRASGAWHADGDSKNMGMHKGWKKRWKHHRKMMHKMDKDHAAMPATPEHKM